MNTPAHVIFGLTAFGKADQKAVTSAAIFGALLPDLSLYLMAGVHLFLMGTSPEVVFGELYFSDAWQNIFRIDNSIILWGIAFVLSLATRSPVLVALCGAVLLHLILDFGFHHDDGRAHFWPLTDWVFASPVSYWDPNHFGLIVGPLEVVIVLICCLVLWRRFTGRWMRSLVVVVGLMEVVPVVAFSVMFATGNGPA